jgi:hypothetical protein
MEDLPPVADLPCGGADLETNNENCGTCGNECRVSFAGTKWEAGACVNAECGPNWSGLIGQQSPPLETCVDVCEFFSATCVSGGCAGVTGIMIDIPWFDPPVDIGSIDTTEIATCNDPLHFTSDDETHSEVLCCCIN